MGQEKPLYSLLLEEASKLDQIYREALNAVEPLSILQEAGCIAATGSGDSYAAALGVASLVEGRGEAVDPLEARITGRYKWLLSNSCILVAISIGGRTRRVIELASLYLRKGGRVVCYTSQGSPLAQQACSEVVAVPYTRAPMGVGAARQLALLAVIAKSLGYEPRLVPLDSSCEWLEADMFTGIAESLAAALYAANKMYEIYASPARWEFLEQLVHAPIYSVKSVALFHPARAEQEASHVARVLEEAGIKTYVVPAVHTPWDNLVSQTAHVVKCIAKHAERQRVTEPAYRKHPGLEPLTRLIYG